MKKVILILASIGLLGLIGIKVQAADNNQNDINFGLKIAPTSVEATVNKNQNMKGYIDISNPDNVSKTIITSVSAFKQINNNGDLQFYNDADLSKSILLDLSNFELGPHEAVRMYYMIKPQNLPPGGTYATIFFTAKPIIQTNNPKNINISTKVGTLLILTNGDGQKDAKLSAQHIPFWQFGRNIRGSVEVRNTGGDKSAIAFHPEIEEKIEPWGHTSKLDTPLVFPGISRTVAVDKQGSYLGFLPYTIIVQGKKHIIWIFATTGYWRLLVPCIIIVFILAISVIIFIRRRNNP
jgi:hypothetical protein